VLLSISGSSLNVNYVLFASYEEKNPKKFFFSLACLLSYPQLPVDKSLSPYE